MVALVGFTLADALRSASARIIYRICIGKEALALLTQGRLCAKDNVGAAEKDNGKWLSGQPADERVTITL